MKGISLKLNLDLNSLSNEQEVKTPILLRNRDYSPIPLDSPNSIKHRIIEFHIEEKVSVEESKNNSTNYLYNRK